MDSISIVYLLRLALRRAWALVLAGVIFAGAAFAYCRFVAVPVYSASSSILVTNGGIVSTYDQTTTYVNQRDAVSTTDLSASRMLTDTVVDILKTSDIYMQLAEKLGDTKDKFSIYKGMASIAKRSDDTLFIDITFSSTDPENVKKFANEFAEISCDYITEFIPYAKVSVTEKAMGAGKISPRNAFITGLAGLAGVVVGFAIVLIVDFLNQSIRGEEEFIARYDVPLIGSIPDFDIAGMSYGGSYAYSKGGAYYGKK